MYDKIFRTVKKNTNYCGFGGAVTKGEKKAKGLAFQMRNAFINTIFKIKIMPFT